MHTTSLPCPNCQQPFHLTYDYLQSYGGRVTTCPSCQQRFTLPTTEEVFGAMPTPPGESPDSRSPPTLSYATSTPTSTAVAAPAGGIWREGWLAYVSRNAVLPEVCFRCGTTDGLELIQFNLEQQKGKASKSALVGGLVGGLAGAAIGSMIDNALPDHRMLVRAHACHRHRSNVNTARVIMIALLATAVGSFIGGLNVLLNTRQVTLGITLIAIAPFLGIAARILHLASPTGLAAVKVDRHGGFVSGFGRNFLLKLKTLQQARAEHSDQVAFSL